jgi:hypothetical protein
MRGRTNARHSIGLARRGAVFGRAPGQRTADDDALSPASCAKFICTRRNMSARQRQALLAQMASDERTALQGGGPAALP